MTARRPWTHGRSPPPRPQGCQDNRALRVAVWAAEVFLSTQELRGRDDNRASRIARRDAQSEVTSEPGAAHVPDWPALSWIRHLRNQSFGPRVSHRVGGVRPHRRGVGSLLASVGGAPPWAGSGFTPSGSSGRLVWSC